MGISSTFSILRYCHRHPIFPHLSFHVDSRVFNLYRACYADVTGRALVLAFNIAAAFVMSRHRNVNTDHVVFCFEKKLGEGVMYGAGFWWVLRVSECNSVMMYCHGTIFSLDDMQICRALWMRDGPILTGGGRRAVTESI